MLRFLLRQYFIFFLHQWEQKQKASKPHSLRSTHLNGSFLNAEFGIKNIYLYLEIKIVLSKLKWLYNHLKLEETEHLSFTESPILNSTRNHSHPSITPDHCRYQQSRFLAMWAKTTVLSKQAIRQTSSPLRLALPPCHLKSAGFD